jgi:hypothetical protein
MAIEIATPVGRIVWGHPTKSKNKTRKNPSTGANEVVLKDGQPVQQWSLGVAFPKAEFQAAIWPAMAQEAATVFPNGTPPKFSWKYQDGDGIDDQGKPFNLREGYAGCYVLAISSELMAPPLFKLNGGKYDQLPGDAVKCGDYVVCGLNIKANVPVDRTHTPGLYINPLGIEFVGYGTEIQSQGAIDPMAIFKGAQHQLPAGASATPVQAPGAPGMPGMGAGAAPMAAQPGMMAQPGMAQPGQPPMAVQPAMMAPPAMLSPPVAPVGPQRPSDPSHVGRDPTTGAEMWWNGAAWTPAPIAPPPAMLPPPAHDFVANAGMPAPLAAQPGMMAPPTTQPGMPGMMPPR